MTSRPWIFDAIGTRWQIDVPNTCPQGLQEEALRALRARVEIFDKDYSRFRDDSLVIQMSQKAGTYSLPSDAQPLFDLYRELYQITHGAFTPLIGQTLVSAGYDALYSLKPDGVPLEAPPWEVTLDYTYPSLTLHRPALLDVGAAGKGYLVDIVGELLHAFGIPSFCIDAGGDMLYRNDEGQPLRVGLEDPRDASRVIGLADMRQGSICGSAGNRRAWADFHHLIDPRTLSSPQHLLATWVVADTALLADALATCLFLAPAQTLHAHYDFAHCMLYPDMTVEVSSNFPGEMW